MRIALSRLAGLVPSGNLLEMHCWAPGSDLLNQNRQDPQVAGNRSDSLEIIMILPGVRSTFTRNLVTHACVLGCTHELKV